MVLTNRQYILNWTKYHRQRQNTRRKLSCKFLGGFGISGLCTLAQKTQPGNRRTQRLGRKKTGKKVET